MGSQLARVLRNAPTNAEYKLWPLLRGKHLCGLRIRRQFAIGPYVADFACLPARLIVEIDGDTHLIAGAPDYDRRRTKYLEDRGFAVIRFWNIDVYADASSVADAIGLAIEQRMAELGRPMPVRP